MAGRVDWAGIGLGIVLGLLVAGGAAWVAYLVGLPAMAVGGIAELSVVVTILTVVKRRAARRALPPPHTAEVP